MLAPVGARSASWSRVRTSPPAFSILALAVEVKRRAATDSLGIVRRRLSSVTVPITTMVLPLWASVVFLTMRESDTGGRLILDMNKRRSTTLLKFDSVRPVESSDISNRGLEKHEYAGQIKHTREEAVEFHQNLQIDILALGRLAVGVPHMMAVQIDTCDLEVSKKLRELDKNIGSNLQSQSRHQLTHGCLR